MDVSVFSNQQFQVLMNWLKTQEPVLKQIAQPSYTLTGAQDWPLLMALFGVIVFLLIIVITLISFQYVSTSTRSEKSFDEVWNEIRSVKADIAGKMLRLETTLNASVTRVELNAEKSIRELKEDMKDCKDFCCGKHIEKE